MEFCEGPCYCKHGALEACRPQASAELVTQNLWLEAESQSEGTLYEVAVEAEIEKKDMKLSTHLKDTALLRGVGLVEILQRAGRHFRSSALSNSAEADVLYEKSMPVQRIDYFISHCWSDGRVGKVYALWIHSNLTPAMLISTVVATTCTVLCRVRILPVVTPASLDFSFFPWALLLGFSSFFLVLGCWQHVQKRFGSQAFYFLDKFCVHQTDLELKHAGVASFAAFVALSERVLVLWSPRYFERLWCMLEIAAFVKTHATDSKTALPLDFLPLQLAKLSFYLWLTGFLVHVAVQVNTTMNKPVPDIYFIAGTMLVAAYFQIDAFRQYAVDRSSLEQQLRSFSVQSAMCSDLQDRSTIEKTILGWFDTDDIEVCNRHIREVISDQVMASLGPAKHYPSHMLAPLFLLHIFVNADYASGTWYDVDTFWRVMGPLLGFGIWMLVMVPLSFPLAHGFSTKCRFRSCNKLLNLFLAVIVTLGWLGGWYVNYFFVGFQLVPAWLAILLLCMECLLFVLLQRASFRSCATW